MQHAEKICRKIKCCRIPFLPEASIWIQRVQVYYAILRFHRGKIKNRGNLKRAARRCNIPNPLSLSIQDILACLEVCKKECAFYQEHGQRFRRKHLNTRLRLANEQEDKEAFQKNQLNHTAGTPEKLLTETKLRDGEEKDEKCHLNSGRRSGRITNGTYGPGVR